MIINKSYICHRIFNFRNIWHLWQNSEFTTFPSFQEWLNPEISHTNIMKRISGSPNVKYHEVSSEVNNARNNTATCMKPVDSKPWVMAGTMSHSFKVWWSILCNTRTLLFYKSGVLTALASQLTYSTNVSSIATLRLLSIIFFINEDNIYVWYDNNPRQHLQRHDLI